MKKHANNTKALIICHGASELILAKDIRSKLRLPIVIDADNNGKKSIQITSLLKFLSTRPYKSMDNFVNEVCPCVQVVKGKLQGFNVFPIMDIDDANNVQVERYINKQMYLDHWMYPYIVPIYNNPNLDCLLIKLGYKIDKGSKIESYRKVFPGGNGPLDGLIALNDQLEKNRNFTNLHVLLTYLLAM